MQAEERSRFARREREQFHHQTHYSSGDIYHKVRHYMARKETEAVEEWKIRLSDSKQICLSRFLKHQDYVEAFDNLQPFPGLLKGFELGNVRKHFALHCDAELLYHLRHVHLTWDKITLGNPIIQQAVDIKTVEELQSRAPSASSVDRELITSGMENGTLFSVIVDRNLRQSVKEALLELDVMIPTVKTFHKNVSYFQIGAKILWAQLFQTQLGSSLFETMYDHWSPPKRFSVEVREGQFEDVDVPRLEQVHLAYIQLWLFVLRHFPSLSNCAPRLDKRRRNLGDDASGNIDSARVIQLQNLAHRVGFSSDKILHGLKQQLIIRPHDWISSSRLNCDGEDINRRCGRPFSSSFTHIEKNLFLPNLSTFHDEGALNPSVLFIQQDIIKAFLGSRVNSLVMTHGISPTETILLPESRPMEPPAQLWREFQPKQVATQPSERPQPREEPQWRNEPQPRKAPKRKKAPGKPPEPLPFERDTLEDPKPPMALNIGKLSTASDVASVPTQDNGCLSRSSFTFCVIERHSMGQHPVNYIHDLHDIERYLLGRQGWVMTTLYRGVLRTIRHEEISDYMVHNPEGEYFMVSADYIQEFIQNQYKAQKVIEACESKVESRKRTRIR
jgi:hypothetical protein